MPRPQAAPSANASAERAFTRTVHRAVLLALPTLAQAGTIASPAQTPAKSATCETLHVLLVEDRQPTVQALARVLATMGRRVTTVSTAVEARRAARSTDCNFLISDLGLPDGSGLELMTELQACLKGRAIARSGHGMESDVRAVKEAGFAEHLTKPTHVPVLRPAIARISSPACYRAGSGPRLLAHT